MPIYARNSLGSNIKVVANENYSYADMGRILSECVQNDMTLFNAVLLNDFKESTAIREGTMVSSELTAFREASIKGAWASLKAKLQKLWEKIKGVFRSVYSKLTVWLVRNGKAFVGMHRKTLANKPRMDACKLPKVYVPTDFLKNENLSAGLAKTFGEDIEKLKGGDSDDRGADAITVSLLQKSIDDASSTSDYKKKFKEKAFEKKENTTWGAVKGSYGGSVDGLLGYISSASKGIKDLKDAEKKADKSIKDAIGYLKKAAANAEKEEKGSGASYKNASACCSAYERAISIVTACEIGAIRTQIKQARMIAGALVAYNPNGSENANNESAILQETAWLEGADDFATVDDIPAEEIKADDVQSDPDVEINVTVDDDGNECSK